MHPNEIKLIQRAPSGLFIPTGDYRKLVVETDEQHAAFRAQIQRQKDELSAELPE